MKRLLSFVAILFIGVASCCGGYIARGIEDDAASFKTYKVACLLGVFYTVNEFNPLLRGKTTKAQVDELEAKCGVTREDRQ